ncbi:DUF6036 family nucleotidyltransferase [Roseivirga sp.]|uniref:DUF6036 family nucleotidyltransferase n=1 Tax=Roseivirga sp. TaxID=1964215 RepID=UPI003B520788
MNNIFNPDFLEFCESLNKSDVEYILVGGYSVILHGYPRTTGDLDIWVRRDRDNYKKLLSAFDMFRLPVFDMTEDAFLDIDQFDVFRFGRPPVAIDIITELAGVDFSQCYSKALKRTFEGVTIRFLDFEDLIRAKTASGRPKDINDIENLEK